MVEPMISGRLAAEIARAAITLRESDQVAAADRLLRALEEADAPHSDYEPTPESTDSLEGKSIDRDAPLSAAERARRYRASLKASRTVTENVTRHVTVRDGLQKGSQTLQKAEEKRNLSDFRAVAAEIETFSQPESSQIRALSVTDRHEDRHEMRDASRDESDGPRDVTAALRVLKRLQLCIGLTWDFGSYRTQLDAIACKPEAELEKVLATLSRDSWVKARRGVCTPKHVLAQWNRYLEPPSAPTKRGPVRAPSAEEFDTSGSDVEVSHG
jgi:hypothetical protein